MASCKGSHGEGAYDITDVVRQFHGTTVLEQPQTGLGNADGAVQRPEVVLV